MRSQWLRCHSHSLEWLCRDLSRPLAVPPTHQGVTSDE